LDWLAVGGMAPSVTVHVAIDHGGGVLVPGGGGVLVPGAG
jgi:hypothetical protein